MKTLAAILVAHNQPLELVTLEIPPLQPGQVLVEIAYAGVCGTQIGEWKGTRGPDAFLPHCLGHEASGVVVEVGSGVSKVKAGDAVVCSWMKGSGVNVSGTRYHTVMKRVKVPAQVSADGKNWTDAEDEDVGFARTINAGAITTFQRHAVISENRLTVLPSGFNMKAAALLGCPIPTGIGAVWNTAGAKPGQSVVVFGCGGVGLAAIAGARLAGCIGIDAVDIDSRKHEVACAMGASVAVTSYAGFPAYNDIAIECTGSVTAMQQAMYCVRPRGGIVVVVGNAKHGEYLQVVTRWLNDGKQLRGSWGGDNNPDVDFPRYIDAIASGRLDVGPMIGKVWPLEQVNEAMAAMASGCVGRSIITMKEI
jgi:S-(hydroxymethyl)glutathione dehydrogenase / alcohol dehydrogenase